MQLKKLEETLGVQLFERNNKQVMLTEIGKEITRRARSILEEAAEIRALSAASSDALAGELKLGIFPTLAPYLLPSLMPQIGNRFPKLNLLLVEEKTPELLRQLEAGEIDAAMLAMPAGDGMFDSQTLFDEPFFLAVAKHHKLAGNRTVALADIRDVTMLLLEDGHCLREQALSVCRAMGAGEAKNFRATSLETLRHMVAASDRVTLIPKLATRDQDPALCYISFEAPAPSRTIGLYWRKTSGRTKLFEALAQMMREDYAGL